MASFNEAFKAARKAQGAGGEFTWKGKSYSTNIAGETGKKKKPSFSTDMAEKAIDRASGIQTPNASTPRPRKRPTKIATGIDMGDGGITVTELPPFRPTNLDKLKSEAAEQTRRSNVNQGAKELMTGRKGAAAQYKEGGVVKMKKSGATTTSEGLKALALRVGNEKANASLKQRNSYNDKGVSGRDWAAKQDEARMKSLTATYDRSKDLIERYGTDAPKARGFMAYEGQSGTTKKKSGGVVKKAGGGSMRGTGAAVRGKGFSGCY